jgi:hypothetical protein
MKKLLIGLLTFGTIFAHAGESQFSDFRVFSGKCEKGSKITTGFDLVSTDTGWLDNANTARLVIAKNNIGQQLFNIFPYGNPSKKDVLNSAIAGELDFSFEQTQWVSDFENLFHEKKSDIGPTESGYRLDSTETVTEKLQESKSEIIVSRKRVSSFVPSDKNLDLKQTTVDVQTCRFNK